MQKTLSIILPTESNGQTIPNWQSAHEEYISGLARHFGGLTLPNGFGASIGAWVNGEGKLIMEFTTIVLIKTSQVDSEKWLANIAKDIACRLKQEAVYIEIDSLASTVSQSGELTTL